MENENERGKVTVHDNNEPSYYEIALTNRQVVVAFVLILGSLLAAFLSGVWIGRQDAGPRFAQGTGEEPTAGAEVADLDSPREFGFFSDEDADEEDLDKPDLSRLLDEPRRDTTLAEDVGADKPMTGAEDADEAEGEDGEVPLWKKRALARKAEQEEAERRRAASSPPPPVASPPPAVAASPPAASPSTAPPPPAVPAVAAPAAMEGFVIQVLSTREEPKARKIHDELEAGGFEVFTSPVEVDGHSMYRVRVGPFADRAAAEKAAELVNSRFKLDTWVTAASP